MVTVDITTALYIIIPVLRFPAIHCAAHSPKSASFASKLPFLSFDETTRRLSVHLYQLQGSFLNSTPLLVNHTTPSEIAGIDLHYFLQKERTRL